jgi:SAM-dependent methyltransferase
LSRNNTPAATYLPSLQRGKTGYDDVLELLASLVNIGHPVKTKNASLESITDSPGKMLTDLPTYQFNQTDISSRFFEAARTKFRTTGGKLNFLKLDICADIEQQGFLPGSHDLVIAADVIHATPDLALSLCNIRKLLKPTGSLALVELSSCTPSMFPFATLPGWWYRSHEDGAFVPEQEWQDLLVGSGFNGVEASLKDHPEDHQHSIIWSRAKPTQADSHVSLTLLDDAHTATGFSTSLAAHCSKAPGAADIKLGRLTDRQ